MRTNASHDLGSHSEVHSEECDAVSSFSERQAVLAVISVRALIERFRALGGDFASDFPVEFLLEVGAIAMLHSWDETGIRPLLPPDVPTPQAAASLARKQDGSVCRRRGRRTPPPGHYGADQEEKSLGSLSRGDCPLFEPLIAAVVDAAISPAAEHIVAIRVARLTA